MYRKWITDYLCKNRSFSVVDTIKIRHNACRVVNIRIVGLYSVYIKNLSQALDQLNKPMWEIHDQFHVINEQIEKEVSDALVGYSDFTENPLIKQNTKNCRDLMTKTLSLI